MSENLSNAERPAGDQLGDLLHPTTTVGRRVIKDLADTLSAEALDTLVALVSATLQREISSAYERGWREGVEHGRAGGNREGHRSAPAGGRLGGAVTGECPLRWCDEAAGHGGPHRKRLYDTFAMDVNTGRPVILQACCKARAVGLAASSSSPECVRQV